MDDPRGLSNEEIQAALERFASEERERMSWFLACLGEADRRGFLIGKGYSSTFDYCVRRLKLSEDESCRRIQAARAGVSRPELLSAMSDGRLSLTSISKLAPHVRRADAPQIIARAEGKSLRELDALLAPLSPEPVKRDRVRTVAVASSEEAAASSVPVTRVDFSFRGSLELRDAIDRAKDLLSHKFPFGELDGILLEIVRDYLGRHDPQRPLKPRKLAPAKTRSGIPSGIRRAIWARDGGRCTFTGPGGVRCESRRMLGLDHRKPRSLGGKDTVENLRLLCRPHNDAERRRILGEGDLFTDPFRNGLVDNSNPD